MIDEPQVSIIIVSHGRLHDLVRAVNSLRFQRYNNFEVIVVSEHRHSKLLNKIAINNPIKAVTYNDMNISEARNLGISQAAGSIIAFIDDDAIPEFSWLERLIPAFDNARVGAAGGYVLGRNGINYQWQTVKFDQYGDDLPVEVTELTSTQIYVPSDIEFVKTPGTNCAFRRSALDDVHGFDPNFKFFLDETDLNVRLTNAGWYTAIVPDAIIHHGYCPSNKRSQFRVPKTLYEIGASKSYFLKKHSSNEHLSEKLLKFELEQKNRLLRFMHLGLIEPRQIHILLQDLRAGFKDGLERHSLPASYQPILNNKFISFTNELSGARTAILATLGHRKETIKEAVIKSVHGDEVSVVISALFNPRNAVQFEDEGYWRHSIGFIDAFKCRGFRAAMKKEQAHIIASREINIF